MIEFLGLNFHLYGLVVGVAVALVLGLTQWRAKSLGIAKQEIRLVHVWLLVGALVGARVWHIVTDWQIYQLDPARIFKIWEGGLSILGAMAGMAIALYWAVKKNKTSWLKWLDILAIALPFGQALGRLANYFNQEIYGLPTNLPWGITINSIKYHPLFAYEALLTAGFGGVVWYLMKKTQKLDRLKTGNLFFIYIVFYSLVRFCLDFLRADLSKVLFGLGINQVVLLLVIIGVMSRWWKKVWEKGLLVIGIVAVILGLATGQKVIPAKYQLEQSTQYITVENLMYAVEVVDTPDSITQGLSGREQIGSQGMLFLFGRSQQANFWMKDMKFNLDLVWINDEKIVGITNNVLHPKPNTPDSQLPTYFSPQVVDMVLEVPAGFAQEEGWQTGNQIDFLKQ